MGSSPNSRNACLAQCWARIDFPLDIRVKVDGCLVALLHLFVRFPAMIQGSQVIRVRQERVVELSERYGVTPRRSTMVSYPCPAATRIRSSMRVVPDMVVSVDA